MLAQSCQSCQSQPLQPLHHGHQSAHFRSVFAPERVTVHQSSLVNTISSPQNSAAHILAPVAPVHHVAPLGIVKFSTASHVVHELVTQASLPAAHVVVLPIVIVAASHWSHWSHFKSLTAII